MQKESQYYFTVCLKEEFIFETSETTAQNILELKNICDKSFNKKNIKYAYITMKDKDEKNFANEILLMIDGHTISKDMYNCYNKDMINSKEFKQAVTLLSKMEKSIKEHHNLSRE